MLPLSSTVPVPTMTIPSTMDDTHSPSHFMPHMLRSPPTLPVPTTTTPSILETPPNSMPTHGLYPVLGSTGTRLQQYFMLIDIHFYKHHYPKCLMWYSFYGYHFPSCRTWYSFYGYQPLSRASCYDIQCKWISAALVTLSCIFSNDETDSVTRPPFVDMDFFSADLHYMECFLIFISMYFVIFMLRNPFYWSF